MSSSLQAFILSLGLRGSQPSLRERTDLRTFTWTYADLAERITATAGWLDRHGITQGSRMILWAPNSTAWVAAFLAALASGVIAVPLDVGSTPEFVEQVAREVEASLLIRGRYQPWLPFTGRSMIIDELEWEARGDRWRRPAWPVIAPDDLAEILYTSGTTARPRGVMLTHRNLISDLQGVQPVVPPGVAYRLLSLLPLSHAFEQVIGLLLALSRGATITYLEVPRPSEILTALREDRINTLLLVPGILDLLRAQVVREMPPAAEVARRCTEPLLLRLPFGMRRTLLAPLRCRLGAELCFLVVGGAPLDKDLEQFWDALGILVLQGYGLTEAGPVVSANTVRAHRIGSVGRPIAGVEIRIAPDEEILVRGPNVTPGYYRRPDATAEAFTDSWLRTGDLGCLDRDGYLYILGRKKSVIVTSAGLKVYPEDVEAALARQPGVRDSVVLPWQGKIFAVLLLEPTSVPRAAAIVEAANRQLSPAQRIQGWVVWPGADFPRTPTMKVERYRISEVLPELVSRPTRVQSAAGLTPLQRIIHDLARDRPVRPEARLGIDLGLSSIDRLELLTRIEEELRVDIPETLVTDQTSVAELEHIVRAQARLRPWRPPVWPLHPWIARIRAEGQRHLIFPLLRCIVTLTIHGGENLRNLSPPVLLAGNHASLLDAPLVLMALPNHLRHRTAIAALAGFQGDEHIPQVRRAALDAAFWLSELLLNTFPVPRATGYRESLKHVGFLVDHGWNVLIFPEGTRSRTGALQPFREGIGLLATGLQVPVVPFRLRGTFDVLPRGAWLPRPGPVAIHFGAPTCYPPLDYASATRAIENAVKNL